MEPQDLVSQFQARRTTAPRSATPPADGGVSDLVAQFQQRRGAAGDGATGDRATGDGQAIPVPQVRIAAPITRETEGGGIQPFPNRRQGFQLGGFMPANASRSLPQDRPEDIRRDSFGDVARETNRQFVQGRGLRRLADAADGTRPVVNYTPFGGSLPTSPGVAPQTEEETRQLVERGVDDLQRANEIPMSPTVRRVGEAAERGDVSDTIGAVTEGGVTGLASLIVGNLAAQPGELATTTVGSLASGPLAPFTGAGLGGLSAYSVEARYALLDTMQNAGVDLSADDADEQVLAFLADPEAIAAWQDRAVRRGVPIAATEATVSALTFGLGRLAIAGRIGRRTAAGTGFTLETAGEGAGELAAQATAGDELNFAEATVESIAGGGQSAATAAIAQAGRRNRRAQDAQELNAEAQPEAAPDPEARPDAEDALGLRPDVEARTGNVGPAVQPEVNPQPKVANASQTQADRADDAASAASREQRPSPDSPGEVALDATDPTVSAGARPAERQDARPRGDGVREDAGGSVQPVGARPDGDTDQPALALSPETQTALSEIQSAEPGAATVRAVEERFDTLASIPTVAESMGQDGPDYLGRVASESQNPAEVLAAYESALDLARTEQQGPDPRTEAMRGVRVSTESFDAFSDPERRREGGRSIAANWLTSDVRGRGLDELAQEIESDTGIPTTEQDLVSIIEANPGGIGRGPTAQLVEQLANRFSELTGTRLTERRVAGAQPAAEVTTDETVPFRRFPNEDGQLPLFPGDSQALGDRVQAATEEVARAQGLPGVEVYDSADALSETDRARLGVGTEGGAFSIPAFQVSADGESRVVMLADEIARLSVRTGESVEQTAQRFYLHEVVAHQGLRALFGDRAEIELARLYGTISLQRIKEAGIYREYRSLVERGRDGRMTRAGKALLAEEYIARLAEGQIETNPSLLRRIYERIRVAVKRAFGRDVTDDEIRLLLVEAADALRAQQQGQEVEGSSRFAREKIGELRFARTDADTPSGDGRASSVPRIEIPTSLSRRLRTEFPRAYQQRTSAALRQATQENPTDYARRRDQGLTEAPRPDLANPAEDEGVRRIVDATDEIRTGAEVAGAPGSPDVRTFDAMRADADRMLADDYEGTKARLFRGDMRSDADVMAAKRIIDREGADAIASGDLTRIFGVAKMVSAYRDLRTEQARALAAGRDPSATPAERAGRVLTEAVTMPPEKVRRELDKAKTEAQRERILRRHAKRIAKIRDGLAAMGIDLSDLDERDLLDRRKLARAVRLAQAGHAGVGDMMYEYWINGILSAPTTQLANIIGNTVNAAWDFTIQRFTEAVLNDLLPGKNKADAATLSEFKYLIKGMLGSTISDAWRRAGIAFDTEAPILEEEIGFRGRSKFDDTGDLDLTRFRKAISGTKGRVVRLPGRGLVGTDEFYKSIFYNSHIGPEAHRIAKSEGLTGDAMSARMDELMRDPQSIASINAFHKALELTFQEDPGPLQQSLLSLRNSSTAVGTIARYIIPFVTTPSNILKTSIRKSPLGAINLVYRGARQGAYSLNLTDNATWVYDRKSFIRDAAEQVLTWGAMVGVMALVFGQDDDDPIITGSGPSFREQGRMDLARRAVPPNSVKIGGTYYDYNRIEPIGTSLALMVNAAEAMKRAQTAEEHDQALGEFFVTSKRVALDKSYLMGFGDLFRALEYNEGALNYATNFGTSWVPNIVRSAARATDPTFRESQGANAAEKFQRRLVPAPQLQSAPAYDLWGRPALKEGATSTEGTSPFTTFLWDFTVPLRRKEEMDESDPASALDRLILRWNASQPFGSDTRERGFYPAPPRDSFTRNGLRFDMTTEEYAEYLRRSGQGAVEQLQRARLNYENPTERDLERIESAIRRNRERVKNQMIREREFSAYETYRANRTSP